MGAMGLVFLLAPGALAWLMAPGAGMAEVRARAVPPSDDLRADPNLLRHLPGTQPALRGAGDTRGPMAITYLSTFLVRLPAAWLLGVTLGYGLSGVWFALCGELVVRGTLYYLRFRGGRGGRCGCETRSSA